MTKHVHNYSRMFGLSGVYTLHAANVCSKTCIRACERRINRITVQKTYNANTTFAARHPRSMKTDPVLRIIIIIVISPAHPSFSSLLVSSVSSSTGVSTKVIQELSCRRDSARRQSLYRSRWFDVIDFGTNRNPYAIKFSGNTNLHPISHRFPAIAQY